MNIRVSYAELESAAAQLGAGRDDISAKLAQLQQQIGQLVISGFVTQHASGKFAAAYENYNASARAVIEQLSDIQGYLLSAAQVLQDTDSQLAARIG